MKTIISSLVLVTALSGCGLIKVNGGGAAEPEASPTPAASETEKPSPSEAAKADAPKEKQQTKGDLQCQSSFMGALQHLGAIERNGEVFISTANEGFSADPLKASVTSCYKGYNETPSAEVLAKADASMKEQRDAAIAAAPKWKMPDAAAADAAAEAAIKKDFLEQHPGSDIKRIYMTSGWKQNMDGLVVRNRYKDAIVVMGVKGTDICMRVLANAAQDAKGGGFDSKWKHDVFTAGTVVPCK
jgi:hypothetical protein